MVAGMGEKLASLRNEAGMTQESVAHHLGITKAAVSKWECGQSLPDIALLPAVAELYSTTLDELFGVGGDPSQEQVDQSYLKALELLGTDYGEGERFVLAEARAHWSCLPLVRAMATALFAQVPLLDGFEQRPIEGAANQCAREAERLYRRAIALAPCEDEAISDITPLSRILQLTGRDAEAAELLDGFVAKGPSLAAVSLAQLLRDGSNEDEALAVLQRSLLISLVEAQAALVALVPIAADNQLEDIATLAAHLQSAPDYISIFPTLMPTIRLEQARRGAARGDEAGAMEALSLFADDLDESCEVMLNPVNPPLFDRVKEMMWTEAGGEEIPARAEAVKVFRASHASILASDSAFDSLRLTSGFQALIERLPASAERGAYDEL